MSVVYELALRHTLAIKNDEGSERQGIPMTKQWQNDDGYTIQLTLGETRSRIEVKDSMGASLMYREFEYWQRAQAEKEADVLVKLSSAYVPMAAAVAVPDDGANDVAANVSLFRARVPQATSSAA